MEIGVADTRELDVYENLVWSWLLDWDSLVDDGWGVLAKAHFLDSSFGCVYDVEKQLTLAGGLDNLCPLLSWDCWCHYDFAWLYLLVFT